MILVDTSIWIDHFRKSDKKLIDLLLGGQVMCHPFVVGEIALGQLKNRTVVIEQLSALPQAKQGLEHEVLALIEKAQLFGTGVGYVDVHLLTSAKLSDAELWTRDKRLATVASKLKFGFEG